jgi:hypothetical protein
MITLSRTEKLELELLESVGKKWSELSEIQRFLITNGGYPDITLPTDKSIYWIFGWEFDEDDEIQVAIRINIIKEDDKIRYEFDDDAILEIVACNYTLDEMIEMYQKDLGIA